jgi:RNA polymerase sigma factor (sigma-70 family)
MDAANPESVERFEALVHEYARAVRAAIARVGGASGRDLRDDVEQRVFLEIWKQVAREQTIHNPSSYLYRAAVRETVRVLREERRKRGALGSLDESHDDNRGEPVTEDPTPHDRASSRELSERLEEVIASLPAERQQAVRGHLAGLGVQEIMGLRHWSYNKARNLIQRGMADLRQRLLERGIHG